MELKNIYFVGAGGIGMANLVRYYLANKLNVAGYDRTPSDLTRALSEEGAQIVYDDIADLIPTEFRNPKDTLVVYTPAIPNDNNILGYFRANGFEIIKRAALLGKITLHSKGICIAGSHGKTTTSSMVAHLLHSSPIGCNAFLGGILRNYDSNLLLSATSPYSVIEADEYDRSFHHLSPHIAVVTSTDPDHLDIYGNEENYLESFAHFTSLINPGGFLLMHTGMKLIPRVNDGVEIFSYSSSEEGDYHASNIRHENGHLFFDFVAPDTTITDIELGVPIDINIDNAVAAIAIAHRLGVDNDTIRQAMLSFLGAKRRFEIWLRQEGENGKVLIDDYAHSPNEVKASIASVKALYPNRKLSVIFQPHLYTRTRDFAPEFAEALSTADEVILCEIYPARELPIPGVTSEIILNDIKNADKTLCQRKDLLDLIKNRNFDILMTLGAADINVLLEDIKEILLTK
ncbi:MAG: UDP-N-acetylmuramate--L-alanine ligase [Muribaculaceae bacterium]|nr:UDP-N-acetylmuramate--L-alanine ligase [Muribaculaceae bacterium]